MSNIFRYIATTMLLMALVTNKLKANAEPQSVTIAKDSHSDKIAHTVELTNIEFRPNRLKSKPGQTIRFINRDKFKHDVYLVRTANPNIVLVPALTLKPDGSIDVTIPFKGVFTIYCTIHGGMSGKITTTGSFELTQAEKKRVAAMKMVPAIAKEGEKLFWSKAQCYRCHQMGNRGEGLRGPNLQDIGMRSAFRAKDLHLESATAYITQSILEPSAYIVEGYSNDMPKVYQTPINLTKQNLKAVIAYLQSQGGKVDTWGIEIDHEKISQPPAPNPFAGGDSKKGCIVFENFAKCNSCHTVGNKTAVSIGPNFTELGKFRNWQWITHSIMHPNDEVGRNWIDAVVYIKPAAANVVMADQVNPENQDEEADDAYGDNDFDTDTEVSLTGVIHKQTSKGVVLQIGANKYKNIPTEAILRIERHKASRMPANYATLLTLQQFTDLVSYLQSLDGSTTHPD